jgi:hypothetical protein
LTFFHTAFASLVDTGFDYGVSVRHERPTLTAAKTDSRDVKKAKDKINTFVASSYRNYSNGGIYAR